MLFFLQLLMAMKELVFAWSELDIAISYCKWKFSNEVQVLPVVVSSVFEHVVMNCTGYSDSLNTY